MNITERLLADSSRNNPAGAIVAGFSAGAVQSLISALFRDLSFGAGARPIIIGVAVYLLVGLLLERLWRNRLAPNWVLTSLFGSILFIAALLGPAIISGWYNPYNPHQSLMDYFSPEIDAAGSGVILLHLITLPINAIFHYSREIIGTTKKWHAGSDPASILRGE